MAAFRAAVKQGVDAIEIDLRGTKDGAIVIMHDETVDRTTNGNGRVADHTLAELRGLDAGQGESIPTYEDVLRFIAETGVTLLLDIKVSPVLDKTEVVRLTEAHQAVPNVIVGTRSLEDLRTFKALNPDLRTLGFIPAVEDVEPTVQAGADIIRLWPKWIHDDPDLIERIHALGKPVWTTAGEAARAELEELINSGVDGILSDHPAVMNAVLTERNKSQGE
jgi:glycerophosphoryl diester phosphodiesterase